MDKKTYYVTTPIYYPSDPNGRFHIGTAYTTILGDALKRYKKLKGYDTRYLTGTDEHGQKIEEVAKKMNRTPKEHVDFVADKLKELWQLFDIQYDDFIQTSEKRHTEVVEKIFEKLLKQDDIYLGEYEGNYCVPCESFFTETQVGEDKICPDCGRKTTIVKEESYFLRLKKYENQLLEFIENNPSFIQPTSRKNEVVSFIKQGLTDLCVSRTSVKWGIQVQSNPKHTIYVWIDALSNYITSLGYMTDDQSLFDKYWNGDEVVHLVGKDILRFHAIYWPILLMALNIPVNYKLLSHGFYMMKNEKMSKSKGNVIYPEPLVEKYGKDALRYYLLKELPLGNDGSFTPEQFVSRYNSDLTNDLSNLVNRTISMANKYQNGVVTSDLRELTGFDTSLIEYFNDCIIEYHKQIERFNWNGALESIWQIIRRSNKYIDETMPWQLGKEEDKKENLNAVLYNLLEMLRNVAIMVSPVMPDTANSICREINVSLATSFDALVYGNIKEYKVSKKPSPIYMRLDVDESVKEVKKMFESKEAKPEVTEEKPEEKVELIGIEDFMKVDLKVGTIESCEKHPKADRLLVSQINLGEKTVQIVSGVADYYNPDEIIGTQVVVVTNLKPVKLRGVQSEGMVLCAKDDEGLKFVSPSGAISNGSSVK